jgi:FkbM family methyltransferase
VPWVSRPLNRSLLALRRAGLFIQWCRERDPARKGGIRWLLDDPREERRYAYPLHSDSVVLDVGGYRGDWTERLVHRYDPFVHIFEPVPAFGEGLERRFASKPKARVHRFGLADRSSEQVVMQAEDASSAYTTAGEPTGVAFRDVADLFSEEHFHDVALIKMNIEGGEYPLLRRMVEADLVGRCADIQIQFHDFVPDALRQRAVIREALRRTHRLTYDYPFVWENWRRTSNPRNAV